MEDQHHRTAESGVERPLSPPLQPFIMKESVQNVLGWEGGRSAGIGKSRLNSDHQYTDQSTLPANCNHFH
ncbi:MAG: hypothetical protein ABJA10_11215, partial [Aestuariivirga sp.]